MKERIITALCLIAIVVPAVIFGGIFYKIVIGVAMALSVYEMLHICSRPRIGIYMYIIVGLFFLKQSIASPFVLINFFAIFFSFKFLSLPCVHFLPNSIYRFVNSFAHHSTCHFIHCIRNKAFKFCSYASIVTSTCF